jgi:uncharacterized protein YdaU (DUF1376 family)
VSDEKRPLPYYRWYVADYRASRAVQRMDYITKGLYRELLDECWVEGAIPDDIEKLADICGCPIGVMADAWKVLRPRFSPLVGMDGTYMTMTRLEVERTDSDKLRATRALAGAKGGRAKANSGKHKQTVANTPAVAIAEQSSNAFATGIEGDVQPAAALPAPHGAARLTPGVVSEMMAKAARGEITRGGADVS